MQDTSCYHLCYCIPRVASLLAALSSVLSSFNSCSSMLVTILGSSSDLRLTSIWDCSAIWDHSAFHSWPHRHRPPPGLTSTASTSTRSATSRQASTHQSEGSTPAAATCSGTASCKTSPAKPCQRCKDYQRFPPPPASCRSCSQDPEVHLSSTSTHESQGPRFG